MTLERQVARLRRAGGRMRVRMRQRLAIELDLAALRPVLVYQMGKVGSSSVAAVLERAGLPVFHVHRLDAGYLASMRERRAALGWSNPPVPPHDLLGLELRRNVIARGHRATIVTLVRDPIARNFSSYFELLDQVWGTPDAADTIPTPQLVAGFLDRFPHDDVLTWFDDEFRAVTGIDVYAGAFPAEGHHVLETAQLRVLVLKSEIDDAAKREVLSRFFHREIPPIERANATAVKTKGAAYRLFRAAIRLPPSYVDRMLESRYATHFYSREERDRLRQQYLDPAGPAL